MLWLVSILKSIGSWLIPILVQEFVNDFVARRKEISEQKSKQAETQKKSEELVKDSQVTEGMSDDEINKVQESAWRRFLNKPKP
jgi:hypothetical protein